ncbi:hypothetical protein K445DRAFT_195033 [Daldinia sp. EC12]|nr:hypothetical protein K445DRAFT_195033 [Daldinia sp. EC12]
MEGVIDYCVQTRSLNYNRHVPFFSSVKPGLFIRIHWNEKEATVMRQRCSYSPHSFLSQELVDFIILEATCDHHTNCVYIILLFNLNYLYMVNFNAMLRSKRFYIRLLYVIPYHSSALMLCIDHHNLSHFIGSPNCLVFAHCCAKSSSHLIAVHLS